MDIKVTRWLDQEGVEYATEAEAEAADALIATELVVLDFCHDGGVDTTSLANWLHEDFVPRDKVAGLLRAFKYTLRAEIMRDDGQRIGAVHREPLTSGRAEDPEFETFVKRHLARKITSHVIERILGEI